MDAIAAFASSPSAILHGRVCERFGVDPAAGFTDDPIIATNLRAAIAIAMTDEPEPVADGPAPGRGFLTDDAHLVT